MALIRTVPPLIVTRDSDSDYWRISHNGPASLVIVEAYIVDENQNRLPLGQGIPTEAYSELSDAGLLFSTAEHPWCKGRFLPPHFEFLLEPVSVSRDLIVKYRISGFLGWASRATLRLTGGP